MKLKSGLYETENYHCLGNLNNDNVDLRLIYCGYEDCEAGHRYGPNRREAYVLHVVVKGKGKLEIGTKVYCLTEGDAFLLKPNEEAWYTADCGDPWTYMWIGFQGMKAGECVVNAGFDNDNHVIHGVNHEVLLGYVMEMLKAHSLSYGNSLRRCAYLQMFFAELIEQYQQSVQGIENLENIPGAEQVKRLMIYIAEHYNEKIRINEVAHEMGINRCYLSSAFKRLTGCSPTEYLIQVRMEKAKSLLTKTNYSISRIASEVGYSDQLAFSRMFKRRFGESPKKYREDIEQLVIYNQKVTSEDALL
ncbi:MAG: AraC family transcriptional regulator [Lachnospiraceae bacterium]|nr:AraC family transcriptional regulator [Lachnospiraceae bacterium]